jgi:hypothetical protein
MICPCVLKTDCAYVKETISGQEDNVLDARTLYGVINLEVSRFFYFN